jgi:hypothetical protein
LHRHSSKTHVERDNKIMFFSVTQLSHPFPGNFVIVVSANRGSE